MEAQGVALQRFAHGGGRRRPVQPLPQRTLRQAALIRLLQQKTSPEVRPANSSCMDDDTSAGMKTYRCSLSNEAVYTAYFSVLFIRVMLW